MAPPDESDDDAEVVDRLRRRATRWFSPIGGRTAATALAEQEQVWPWQDPSPTDRPDWQMVELHASATLMAFTPTEAADLIARLAAF